MNSSAYQEPIYGYIFDYMVVDGDVLRIDELIHPKVEAEIAFILAQDLQGPGITGGMTGAHRIAYGDTVTMIWDRLGTIQFRVQ